MPPNPCLVLRTLLSYPTVGAATADACRRTVDWEQGQHLCTLGNWRKLKETRGKLCKIKETTADAWHHTVNCEQG